MAISSIQRRVARLEATLAADLPTIVIEYETMPPIADRLPCRIIPIVVAGEATIVAGHGTGSAEL